MFLVLHCNNTPSESGDGEDALHTLLLSSCTLVREDLGLLGSVGTLTGINKVTTAGREQWSRSGIDTEG